MSLLPISQLWHEQSHILLIANEVVVDDEYGAPPAQVVQSIHFGEHLLIALGSRDAAVDFNDIAELAAKRATARVLDRHRTVTFEIRQVKVSQRRGRKLRPFGRFI